MKLRPLSADDFRLRVPGVTQGRAVLRTIKGARFNLPSSGAGPTRKSLVRSVSR